MQSGTVVRIIRIKRRFLFRAKNANPWEADDYPTRFENFSRRVFPPREARESRNYRAQITLDLCAHAQRLVINFKNSASCHLSVPCVKNLVIIQGSISFQKTFLKKLEFPYAENWEELFKILFAVLLLPFVYIIIPGEAV